MDFIVRSKITEEPIQPRVPARQKPQIAPVIIDPCGNTKCDECNIGGCPGNSLPEECQICGCNCSKTERAICLAELGL